MRKMRKDEILPMLPQEVWLTIFQKLDATKDYLKNMVAIRSVCKQWREVCYTGLENLRVEDNEATCKQHQETLDGCVCFQTCLYTILSKQCFKSISIFGDVHGIANPVTSAAMENKLTNLSRLEFELHYESKVIFPELLSSLGRCVNLQQLHLETADLNQMQRFETPSLPALPKLRSCTLHCKTVSSAIEHFVGNAPLLEKVELHIHVDEPFSLKLPNAHSLCLMVNVEVKLDAPNLTRLTLGYKPEDPLNARGFNLNSLSMLEVLCMRGLVFELFWATEFPVLKEISLCPCAFRFGLEDIPLDTLFPHQSFFQLKHLRLNITMLSRLSMPVRTVSFPALKLLTVVIEESYCDERELEEREAGIVDCIRCLLDMCPNAKLELESSNVIFECNTSGKLVEELCNMYVGRGGLRENIPSQLRELLYFKRHADRFAGFLDIEEY